MNIQKLGGYFLSIFLILTLVSMSYSAADTITSAICGIVTIVKTVMAATMLILVVLAAIIYAAGQVLGAETRARANVWATSMFVGAVIGGLIYLVVPVFLSLLLGKSDITTEC
ncbi:MAG: hypothetical protein PHU63_04485 [Candidatus ainarchaeum sp.]|nr:hypothetical protein [Candidatus ainarchaeum sp.]